MSEKHIPVSEKHVTAEVRAGSSQEIDEAFAALELAVHERLLDVLGFENVDGLRPLAEEFRAIETIEEQEAFVLELLTSGYIKRYEDERLLARGELQHTGALKTIHEYPGGKRHHE